MIFPLRFQSLGESDILFSNEAGDFFLSNSDFLERYVFDELTESDHYFLKRHGHAADNENDLYFLSFLRRVAGRHALPGTLSYVILVPTLRCNLACTYCQVSRVSQHTKGYDWNDETLQAVIRYLGNLETDELKVEFQGGEPTLRLDLLKAVYDFCDKRFERVEYVVCTNLQTLGDEEFAFFERPDVFISTSLDGDKFTHQRNRTHSSELTETFFANLTRAVEDLGPDKVSALPTIDYTNPPDIDALIEAFVQFGIHSIYLRPVNYQGFARKAYQHVRDNIDAWNAYYFSFIDKLIDHNYSHVAPILNEYYFTLCLNRALKAGIDFHVDLRNPNLFGRDYILIDYDGTFYPTDEARMMTRVGHVDLSVGHVQTGIDVDKIAQLNRYAFNNVHEDCIHCAYQPYCGIDLVDDMSRYNRIDTRKHKTWFCRRHKAIFDRIFEYIFSSEPKVRRSLLRWAGLPGQDSNLGVRHDDPAAP